jgi:hypothetical protein
MRTLKSLKSHATGSSLALILFGASAHAATIIQQTGSNDIKFRAGSYDLINGSDVQDNGDGTLQTIDSTDSTLVSFQIQFAQAGDYYLYFDKQIQGLGSDSVYVNHSTGFNTIPGDSSAENWNSLDTGWNGLRDLVQGAQTYSVPAGSPAFAWQVASPGTVTFTVRSREDGLVWENFVFSQSDSLSATDLDNLPLSAVIPEPASCLTFSLGLLMLASRRRRA